MVEMKNRYSRIIEAIFFKYFQKGSKEILFERSEIVTTAKKLRIKLPKNLGIFSIRFDTGLRFQIA